MTKANLKVVDDKKMDSSEKAKALDVAMSQIEQTYGKGSIMKLGQRSVMDVESISTGSLSLDVALGIGGLPKGRIIEIYGPESSGKTTLALHVIAEAQKNGDSCAFIDAEHALDPAYAKKLGVNIDELLISQPDTGEQALEITDSLVRSKAISVLVVDSVAALTPRAEIEGEMGDSHMGLQARLMSQALRKLTGSVSKSNCMVIFINQIRMKIGVMDAHVKICEELFSAAKTEFKHMEYFYYHNCLYDYVWKDNKRRYNEHVSTWDVLHTYPSDYKVIFVGDAEMSPYEITYPGGSTEYWNEESGEKWLNRTLDVYENAIWLNPVPQQYWNRIASTNILQQIFSNRMFPLTIDGIDQAMRELNK